MHKTEISLYVLPFPALPPLPELQHHLEVGTIAFSCL
jgi:hypothetical protein